ncbi:MAG: group III truncated hemoglobin [Proteobacteria bacterium]|nr:group III truncated hemoglobin [Pseudomonadota bacterium]
MPQDKSQSPVVEAVRAVSHRDHAPGRQLGITRDLISQVVHAFYDEIRADALLGPIFGKRIAPERWPAHLETMVEFWSSVLLLTGSYKGKPVPAHLQLGVEDAHFRHWLALFGQVTARLCTAEIAALFMERATRIADSLRFAIATAEAGDGPPRFPAPLAAGG